MPLGVSYAKTIWKIEKELNNTCYNLLKGVINDEIGDYEIDRLLGTIRFNNVRSEDIIAISYKIGKYDGKNMTFFHM